jgi:3-O-alpha-D-mannopyranosyl-alpha-D-mannopyranose xylosylphosphotransferase
MNDDMLLLGELSISDFFSIPFGSVFRLEREFNLRVSPFNTPSNIGDSGEWGGLNHANSVLSQRFPSRPRHYLHHVPKTLTKPIIYEAMHMFPDAINLAATRSFRESKEGEGDIEMGFLITHLRIERWREALLWIWAVGKMGTLEGNEEGVWSHRARAELKNLLHFKAGESAVTVIKQERHTLKDVESVFKSAQGWDAPKATSYSFSSMDGHLPALTMIETPKTCAIGLERCFGSWFASGKEKISAADMFKRLTFEQWECGDCCEYLRPSRSLPLTILSFNYPDLVISTLINQSGKKGLNAFFPSAKTMVSSTVDENLAYLPLTKSWLTTDFSIESIMVGAEAQRPVSLRMWGMRMLSRYLYVTGE